MEIAEEANIICYLASSLFPHYLARFDYSTVVQLYSKVIRPGCAGFNVPPNNRSFQRLVFCKGFPFLLQVKRPNQQHQYTEGIIEHIGK